MFNKIFAELARKAGKPRRLMIDTTQKAQIRGDQETGLPPARAPNLITPCIIAPETFQAPAIRHLRNARGSKNRLETGSA